MGPFGPRWAVNIAYYVLPAAAPKSRKVQMLLKFMALIHAPDIAVMIRHGAKRQTDFLYVRVNVCVCMWGGRLRSRGGRLIFMPTLSFKILHPGERPDGVDGLRYRPSVRHKYCINISHRSSTWEILPEDYYKRRFDGRESERVRRGLEPWKRRWVCNRLLSKALPVA